MIEEIPGVKGLVARMLVERPAVPVREVWEAAARRYPAVESLTVREFGGRFVLPLKRQMRRTRPRPPQTNGARARTAAAPDRPPEPSGLRLLDAVVAERRTREDPPPAAPTPAAPPVESERPGAEVGRTEREAERRRLRTLFYRWALELAMAETHVDLFGVMADVDRYVDEALAFMEA